VSLLEAEKRGEAKYIGSIIKVGGKESDMCPGFWVHITFGR